ncbi:MAG: dTDP-4-dehydrorhamnose reductase [Candidatus Saccharibacteria bacterium]|nr:dTDP-4-dehydrorhamnose reductase [Candidatus Saccharibacteria bacterium]
MNDSEIFIVGANGQLGTALRVLYPNAKSADIDELDITSSESVADFDWSGIKFILNAAAYTNVDGAETPEGRVAAWKVNATAVGYLVKAAITHDITIVHVSSDYVFDGTVNPHLETEDLSPLGVYAQSKAAGDLVVSLAPKNYLLRTSWVIGEGKNFVLTMRSLADQGIKPSVVNDQIGRLTFTSDLANAIAHLLYNNEAYGTYNFTNDGDSVSWADIASIVYDTTGHAAGDVTGVTTAEYYSGKEGIAPRPLQSTLSLDKIKATGFVPRDWREALSEYLTKKTAEES